MRKIIRYARIHHLRFAGSGGISQGQTPEFRLRQRAKFTMLDVKENMRKAILSIILVLMLAGIMACGKKSDPAPSPLTGYTWTQIGPKGGFIPSVVFHPTNPGEVWASGDDGTGLYRSTDYGATWTAVSVAGLNQSSYAIRFDPTDSNIIFAPNHFGRGMLRSVDGGTTWTSSQAGLPIVGNDSQLLWDLAIKPTDHNIVVAATNSGLFISTNNGALFSQASTTGLTGNTQFTAVAYRTDGVLFAGKSDGAFGYSTDNGSTFTQVLVPSGISIDSIVVSNYWLYVGFQTGDIYRFKTDLTGPSLINDSSTGILNTNVLRVFVKPGSSETTDLVLVGTSGNSTISVSRYGLFKSSNSGAGFSQVMNGMAGNYIFSMAVAPDDSNRMIIGSGNGRGIFRSTDGGSNWQMANQNVYASASLALAQDPANPGHLLASNSAGSGFSVNYETFDGGANWTTFSDPTVDDGVFAFDIDPDNSNNILAGTFAKGIWRSTNGTGGPWTQLINSNTYVYKFMRDKTNKNIVYAIIPSGDGAHSVYYSDNGGVNFAARTGIVAWGASSHPSVSGAGIVVNGEDAFTTTNAFISTTPLGLSGFAAGEGGFTAVAINADSPNEVIVGGASGGIYKTTNYDPSGAGVTWTKLTTPIKSILIRDVGIAVRNGRSVYYAVTFGGQTSFTSESTIGFYRSLDGGSAWTGFTDGVYPCTIGWKLLPDASSPNTSFFAGLWAGGLFKLVDNE